MNNNGLPTVIGKTNAAPPPTIKDAFSFFAINLILF